MDTHIEPKPAPRLWPGVALVLTQWFVRFGLPLFSTEFMMVSILGSVALGLAILIWWLFFSRAGSWTLRLGALAVAIGVMMITRPFLHMSISNGMMGMMFYIFAIPAVSLALVAWAVLLAPRLTSPASRWTSLAAATAVACAVFLALRTDGITGEGTSQFAWRWVPSAEEKLLASSAAALPPTAPPPSAAPEASAATPEPAPAKETKQAEEVATPPPPPAPAVWPGFRGPGRNGIAASLPLIQTDWASNPPVEVWRKPIGPAWSSFAVQGDRIYTQEQRGENETVACYDVRTGAPVWAYQDAARFWESNAGAGPRGTPTLHNGRVYTVGGTGIVNVLDARTGARIWRRNAVSDTGVTIPGWGISSSPLVYQDLVIVAASSRLAAYAAADGKPRWFGPENKGVSYSSPQLMRIGGTEDHIVFLADQAVIGLSPKDGKQLWSHPLDGFKSLQPALAAPDGGSPDILVAAGGDGTGGGTRRLSIAGSASTPWTATERWASNGLKPYYSDFVVHNGHAYGFDGHILSCIDLADGKRKWKGGRYGHGQMILLPGQNLLLVLSEEGEIALVEAMPAGYKEVARRPAIEGKTWNHPVFAGDTLLVRNGQEMAAFRFQTREPVARLLHTALFNTLK
jgi:outer membrane protein assembly factor BamB